MLTEMDSQTQLQLQRHTHTNIDHAFLSETNPKTCFPIKNSKIIWVHVICTYKTDTLFKEAFDAVVSQFLFIS